MILPPLKNGRQGNEGGTVRLSLRLCDLVKSAALSMNGRFIFVPSQHGFEALSALSGTTRTERQKRQVISSPVTPG